MIHSTIGVYANGDRKHNGVSSENIASHIWYNITLRPGRALFVDGYCINTGYLSPEDVSEIIRELQDNPVIQKNDTAPYH